MKTTINARLFQKRKVCNGQSYVIARLTKS